jgi:hypothetical protein
MASFIEVSDMGPLPERNVEAAHSNNRNEPLGKQSREKRSAKEGNPHCAVGPKALPGTLGFFGGLPVALTRGFG